MALIKRNTATDALENAIVLDLGDLRRQAEVIKQRAQAEADQLLAEARAEAQRLTEQADARGFESGFASGKAAGYEAGRKEGHEQALKEASEQLQTLQEAWVNAARQWDSERRAMLLDARQCLLTLAVSMAEKIVRRVPLVAPDIIVEQVSEAIEHVARPCDVTIRIHPEDRPLVEEAMPKLLEASASVEHASLIDDTSVSRGGCMVTAGQGRIDATLDTQLNRLVEALLPMPTPQDVTPDQPEAPEA